MTADFATKGWSTQVLARCCTANCRTSVTVLITVDKRNLPRRVTGADICMRVGYVAGFSRCRSINTLIRAGRYPRKGVPRL
jgi:hypothetical protein